MLSTFRVIHDLIADFSVGLWLVNCYPWNLKPSTIAYQNLKSYFFFWESVSRILMMVKGDASTYIILHPCPVDEQEV